MKKIIIALMIATMACLIGCQNPSDVDIFPIISGNETVEEQKQTNSVIKNSTGETIALLDDTYDLFAIVENDCTENLKTAEKVVTIFFGYDKNTGAVCGDIWIDFNVTTSIELYIGTDGKPHYSSI